MKKKMTKKTDRPDPLKVQWYDHFSKQGWTDEDDLELPLVTSVGFKVRENKKVLVLAQNAVYATGFAGAGNNIAIMKKCIKSRKVIK